MQKRGENHSITLVRLMSSVLLGAAAALLIVVVFLLLCAFAISTGRINQGDMMRYTLAGCVISCFLGGLLAVSQSKSKTLVVGLCTGAVFLLLLLSVGLLFYPDVSLESERAGLLYSSLFGGGLAGFMGGKRSKKRRK